MLSGSTDPHRINGIPTYSRGLFQGSVIKNLFHLAPLKENTLKHETIFLFMVVVNAACDSKYMSNMMQMLRINWFP